MKQAVPALETGLVFIFSLFFPFYLTAEEIGHHGFNIEAETSAQQCLSCHDGNTAIGIPTCTSDCVVMGNHSTEKYYPPEKNRELYAPVEQVVARGVKLPDGKVSCISCHDLKNQTKGHLVSPELCSICHIGLFGR